MDNNEMSFESIFNMGVGIKPVAKVNTTSVERFDGDLDSMFADVATSEENLEYLESFENVNNYNTTAKLRMLAKIDKNYSKCNRGIENYVRSMEADAAEAAPADDGKEHPYKDIWKGKKFEATWKHAKWLQTALHAVGQFFVKIWQTIKLFFTRLASKIKAFFAKRKTDKAAKNAEDKLKNSTTTTTATTTTATTTTASSSNSDERKLLETIVQVNKTISRVEPRVNQLNSAINQSGSIPKLDENTPNSEIAGLKWKEIVGSVNIASMKLLSSISNIALNGGRVIINILNQMQDKNVKNNASNMQQINGVKFVGNNKFDKFGNEIIALINEMITKQKTTKEESFRGSNDKDFMAIVNKRKEEFGKWTFDFYNKCKKLAEEYLGKLSDVPAISMTDFTSPSISGKKMADVINKMTVGVKKGINTPIGTKSVLRTMFGIDVGNDVAANIIKS